MKTTKNETITRALKRVFIRIWRVFLVLTITTSMILAFFSVVRWLNKTAHIDISSDNIKEIQKLQAAGLLACFIDDYYFDSTAWSLSGNYILYSRKDGVLEVLLSNGEWQPVEEILLQTESTSAYPIEMPQLHSISRVDYEMITGSTKTDSGSIKYDSELTYLNRAIEDYSYTITAPSISTDIYWQCEEDADIEYLEVRVDSSQVTMSAHTETEEFHDISSKKFRIQATYSYDNKVGGYWQIVSLVAISQYEDGRACFSFSTHSPALSDDAGTTILKAFYPLEFNATVSGNVSFRYGINSENYNLHNEQLYFKVDEQSIKEEMSKVTQYGYIDFDYENGTASIGQQELNYPKLSIDTTIEHDAEKRISSFEFDSQVTDAEINNISLFPNFVTFVSENWISLSIIEVIATIIVQFIPTKKDDALQTEAAPLPVRRKTTKKRK